MSSWRRAPVIGESIRDCFIEGHQDLARRASRSACEKRVQPSADMIFRVGEPPLNIRRQVRRFFVMIRKWMVFRVIFNSKVRGVLRSMIDPDDTLEPQVIAHTVKIDVHYAIPKDIMKPSHFRGLGRYIERKIDQSLIKTDPRARHQLMPAEPDLALVPILQHAGR